MNYSQSQPFMTPIGARLATDSHGVATALGLQVSVRVAMEALLAALESKMSANTLLKI